MTTQTSPTPTKPRGRPAKAAGTTKSDRLELRVNPAERATWQAAAERAGMSLNAWINDLCNRMAKT